VARRPPLGKFFAAFGRESTAALARRVERRIVDLTSFDRRNALIEQLRHRSQDARLRLSAKTEKDDVVLGEDGVVNGWNDGAFVSVNAWKRRLAATDFREEIPAHLVFDGAHSVARCVQFAEGVEVHIELRIEN